MCSPTKLAPYLAPRMDAYRKRFSIRLTQPIPGVSGFLSHHGVSTSHTHTLPPLLVLYFWSLRTLPNILIKVSKLRCYIAGNKSEGQSFGTLRETSIGSPYSYFVSHW